jgi:hypothetical protein
MDTLLRPEHLDRFGIYLVEVHSRKIPDLMSRQHELEERLAALGLNERVLLKWY